MTRDDLISQLEYYYSETRGLMGEWRKMPDSRMTDDQIAGVVGADFDLTMARYYLQDESAEYQQIEDKMMKYDITGNAKWRMFDNQMQAMVDKLRPVVSALQPLRLLRQQLGILYPKGQQLTLF